MMPTRIVEPIRGLGIDPGLASTGISGVVRFPDASYRSLGVRVSRSAPGRDKAFSHVRAASDDARRIREHWVQIRNAIELIKPHAIGIENYLTFEPHDVQELRAAAGGLLGFLGTSVPSYEDLDRILREPAFKTQFLDHLVTLAAKVQSQHGGKGLGQASKTIAVFGAALGAAYTAGVPVFVFQPFEIKKFAGLARGQKASKEQVGAGLEARVAGLREQVAEKVPQKTLREHAHDATGHAILAADAFTELAGTAGLGMVAY